MTTTGQQEVLDAVAATAAATEFLRPLRADIVRPQLAPDAYGTSTATDVIVGVASCRLRAVSRSNAVSAPERVGQSATVEVVVPAGADVQAGDELRVDGSRFEVLWVPAKTFAVELGVLCRSVQ